MEGNSIQLDNQEIQYIYTLYMITPLKGSTNSATYKQMYKYYTKGDMYYKVNKILKKKFEENKNYDRNQLNYFEEVLYRQEEDTFRDIQLEKEFVPKSVEEIISLYRDNNPLFYSNEKLYNYYDTVNDFFITMSYIDNNNN